MSPEQVEKLDEIVETTPGKSQTRPFDHARRVGPDLRDPRMKASQWPCFGNHQEAKAHANPHGSWVHCKICNVRLSYTPRVGSAAQTTKVENEHQVQKMLNELEILLKSVPPTSELCLAMQKKIDAETVLMSGIQKHLEINASQIKPKAKAGYLKMAKSVSPTGSWEHVHNMEAESSLSRDLHAHLNSEEMAQLMATITQRKETQKESEVFHIDTPPGDSP